MIKLIFFGMLLLLASPGAFAQVIAMPGFQNLGSVRMPAQRSATVTFMNNSARPINFFSTYCSGDVSDFNCNSGCFSLSAYGSCTVWVMFSPRSGDGTTKEVTIQASGSGVFTQAQVSGIDEKINFTNASQD
ncbi:MAG: hypothetical protein H7333_02135 [Bdellovibrionales bacterium]|nr:hypothetical protein [Oligoflexia bacterium]